MYYYCYRINFEDGHYYIGKHRTNNLNDNYPGSGTKLSEFKKENPDIKWTKEILCFCKNKGEVFVTETKLIGDLWKTDPLCLNLTSGGSGGDGHPNSEEARKKMSISHTGKKLSEKTKQLVSEHCGMKNPEVAEKVAVQLRGKPRSEEIKKKISNTEKGKKVSNETRKRISLAGKGRTPWNKGLSKETDERVKKYSEKISITKLKK